MSAIADIRPTLSEAEPRPHCETLLRSRPGYGNRHRLKEFEARDNHYSFNSQSNRPLWRGWRGTRDVWQIAGIGRHNSTVGVCAPQNHTTEVAFQVIANPAQFQ